MNSLNVEKTTIILTTHYMDEAERLCNRIAFVDQGRLIALDTMENLRRSFPVGDLIEIGVVQITGDLLARIREIPQVGSVDVRGQNLLIVTRDASIVLPDILQVLEQFSNPMTSICNPVAVSRGHLHLPDRADSRAMRSRSDIGRPDS